MTDLVTDRLRLSQWRDEDREPFAALNADPEVMEHFPSTLTRDQSDALADRIAGAIDERGYGLWAIERIDDGAFLGFTGISIPFFEAPFMPCTEIGWRLSRDSWGHGYATEAARASLEFGFTEVGLDEIVSFTAVPNVRSQAVMQRLGMTRDPADDFDHPMVAEGSPLRRHVLYRLSAP